MELITNTKAEENIVKITGFQPGYDKNSISLYNKIVAGLNTYRLWTATEKDGYGVEFQILEQNNWFCGGGFSYQTTKPINTYSSYPYSKNHLMEWSKTGQITSSL